MLDVMQTIKDEVLDEKLLGNCKDLVEKTGTKTAIIFICNSREAKKHLLTTPSSMMVGDAWRDMIRTVARRAEADAILTIVTSTSVDDEQCMLVAVETMLSRYVVLHPYDRIYDKVVWREPVQIETDGVIYGDLLPTPTGMASA